MSQHIHQGYHQNAAIIVSYQSEDTGKIYFLMGHHSGAFMFPGGQVDQADLFGRTHAQALSHAAQRELKEETGIDLYQLRVQPHFVKTQTYPASADGRYPKKEVHFFHAHLGRLDERKIKQYQKIIRNTYDDLQDAQFIEFSRIQKNEHEHKMRPIVIDMRGEKRSLNIVNYIEMIKINRNLTCEQNHPQRISNTSRNTQHSTSSQLFSKPKRHTTTTHTPDIRLTTDHANSQFFIRSPKAQHIGIMLSALSLVATIALGAFGFAFLPYIAIIGAGLLMSLGLSRIHHKISEPPTFLANGR